MKIAFIIIGIVLAGFLISYALGRSKTLSSKGNDNTTTAAPLNENPYLDLRKAALSVTPQDLSLVLPQDQTVVYGVVMDWEMGEGIATTVAYKTGDASMYLSSGGGVIGGIQHQNVNRAARQFVEKASAYLNKASKAESTPLPDKNTVTFYFLTNKGIYSANEQMQNFENSSSPLLSLFEEGNTVISELQTVAPK